MALPRCLPENATVTDLRHTYADLLEKLRPYGHRLCLRRSEELALLALLGRQFYRHIRIEATSTEPAFLATSIGPSV